MKKKISKKDILDWQKFISGNDKVENKDDIISKKEHNIFQRTIDLHGHSLDQANEIVFKFIQDCYEKKVLLLNIITGKGSRSKNKNDPYKSKNFSILKYSIPDYIENNKELMKLIKKINHDQVNNISAGSFEIELKKKL